MKNTRKQQIEDIYKQHAKSLYQYLYQLSGSSTTGEDLVQETFYKATISLSFYHDHEIRSWLFKVARHAYLDEWRKRKRWDWVPFIETIHKGRDMLSPYEEPEGYVTSLESETELTGLLKQLKETYRTILHLREKEGLTYKEIATILEMNENQVKVTLHRARNRLHVLAKRQHIHERDENEDGSME
ncbi:sigma-70 family RNA polymerase sigma factor [Texcoconibacillus texcoconensis]|uniref:RNA polymerase sigma-70 factor (ECF subfamily) n=1 Tax=Texcoconibacillus texcoconensis TaxID=1095777 RepID=A0A840QIT4_9BACI|nr:sigma-70 family RNA polymerase sigma factor [Texcoconibacillus texcoconensis]MBB5172015.1 RNA polymerase sigma-70 factor (ECF subfamily) [Texcoconibacillus texcoconensis]